MEQIPQWQGVKALLLTVEQKILQGVKVNYPLAQPLNEAAVLQTLIYVPAVTSEQAIGSKRNVVLWKYWGIVWAPLPRHHCVSR